MLITFLIFDKIIFDFNYFYMYNFNIMTQIMKIRSPPNKPKIKIYEIKNGTSILSH